MSDTLPKPLGSALSTVLNYCNIPHQPLQPTVHYTLSEISDNCRNSSATFLRCHLPNKSLRERLRYLTQTLTQGDFMFIGRKRNNVKVGLMQHHEHLLFHIDKTVVLLGDPVAGRHPLEDVFDELNIVYFLCPKFEQAHLVKPFLYRRRKAKQLKKIIDKRDASEKKGKNKHKLREREKTHGDDTKLEQKKKKTKQNKHVSSNSPTQQSSVP